ncbi:MAG: hypothetical protein HRT88_12900, partial [Lentisphaeraceae bacterium]|nr:hypothetical protein [Lentisphaeraceae bacterium]
FFEMKANFPALAVGLIAGASLWFSRGSGEEVVKEVVKEVVTQDERIEILDDDTAVERGGKLIANDEKMYLHKYKDLESWEKDRERIFYLNGQLEALKNSFEVDKTFALFKDLRFPLKEIQKIGSYAIYIRKIQGDFESPYLKMNYYADMNRLRDWCMMCMSLSGYIYKYESVPNHKNIKSVFAAALKGFRDRKDIPEMIRELNGKWGILLVAHQQVKPKK